QSFSSAIGCFCTHFYYHYHCHFTTISQKGDSGVKTPVFYSLSWCSSPNTCMLG
uniref:Uncharacterized protein n=1 Tax=Pundamilia nyererei TaxID=303518 RepID=A0A3B4FHX1_9CICH